MIWDARHLLLLAPAALLALPATAQARRVVYLNFDPVNLVDSAGQDPTMNSFSATGFTAGAVGGWPGLSDLQKAELLWYMKEAGAPFDIEFVLDRPMAGTYDMVVFGSDTDEGARFPGGGCSTAVSLGDCLDQQAENVSFMFWGCMLQNQQDDMKRAAFNTYLALGFGWGLEQLNVSGQIMGNYTTSALKFGDTCVDLLGSMSCSHEGGCASGTQNSTADLTTRIGARVDDGPPTVTITSPADGANVPSDFTVDADVFDMFGGMTVELTIVEAQQTSPNVDPQWVYSWDLKSVPDGLWTLEVKATDADGNVTTDQVQVCVGDGPCDGGSTSGGSTGAGSSGGTGGSTGGSGGSGSTGGTSTSGGPVTTTAPPQTTGSLFGDEPDTGCGCRSDAPAPAPAGLLALTALLGLRRRQR